MRLFHPDLSGLGLVLAILFLVTKLPEVSEEELELDAADQGAVSDAQLARGFWHQVSSRSFDDTLRERKKEKLNPPPCLQQTRPLLGFWAQFF